MLISRIEGKVMKSIHWSRGSLVLGLRRDTCSCNIHYLWLSLSELSGTPLGKINALFLRIQHEFLWNFPL